ncbi:MAG: hypothetical protein PHF45_01615, partial [Candidatus Pacebacteria bacterium]|nr:hypothetical protein [Candidatus Paceibacterota bacterium]
MKKINVPLIIVILMIAAFLIGYGSKNGSSVGLFGGQKAERLAQNAVDYINQNFLASTGGEATLGSINEESGVYKFTILINGVEYTSYITKDGKILFPDGVPLAAESETEGTEENVQREPKTCEDLAKSNEPILEAFIVSQCPFGTQMQRVLNEIVKNIPELKDYIKIEYIGSIQNGKITAMHGDEEAEEHLRQICIREEQKDKYWNYIDCYLKEGKSEQCLESAAVLMTTLNQCLEDKSRGLKYAQLDFNAQEEYGITGSPTLILNKENVSEFDFGGRTAEAVKTVICCGFNSTPDFC